MTSNFTTLAHNLGSISALKGIWHISRKFDGLGFLWDGGVTTGIKADQFDWYHRGSDKVVPTSTGLWSLGRGEGAKVIHAPTFFTEGLPKGVPLQGELWHNDDLQYVSSVCRRKDPDIEKWKKIQAIFYNIKPYSLWFNNDINKYVGKKNKYRENRPFKDLWKEFRVEDVLNFDYRISDMNIWRIPEFYSTDMSTENGKDEAERMVRDSKDNNWEGLMFHNVNKPYECKRSYNILKWKPKYEMEATVTGYAAGKTGKNIGKVGYIEAETIWSDSVNSIHGGSKAYVGNRFEVSIGGLTDLERDYDNVEDYFPVGSTISFTFSGVSQYGIPQSCNVDRRYM